MKRKSLTAEQIRNLNPRRLKEFAEEGLTIEQIALKTGLSPLTVFYRLKEYGIRTKRSRKLTNKKQ